MRKAQVWKEFAGLWRVQIGDLLLPDSVVARCATHAEAMFLAQLLADPHEYLRAAQERAWEAALMEARKTLSVTRHSMSHVFPIPTGWSTE